MLISTKGVWNDLESLSRIAWAMRSRGIRVDLGAADRHRAKLLAAIAEARDNFARLSPSPAFVVGAAGTHGSLKRLFFDELGCEVLERSKETGAPCLDAWCLSQYALDRGYGQRTISAEQRTRTQSLARAVLAVRKPAKLLNTFIDKLPAAGLLRPVFKPWGAITGRWSCSGPNVQQLPKGMRDLYIGPFVCADYNALELRIVAIMAGDNSLIQAFARNEDVHRKNASEIFCKKPEEITKQERNFGKSFVYAANYGAADETIYEALISKGFTTVRLPEISTLKRLWFKAHPEIRALHMSMLREAREQHFTAAPVGGRFEEFPDGHIDASKVLNFKIQAIGAYLANRAIITIHEACLRDPTLGYIALQVHDEIGGVTHRPEAFGVVLKKAMEEPVVLRGQSWTFPVELKRGPNWKDLEDFHV